MWLSAIELAQHAQGTRFVPQYCITQLGLFLPVIPALGRIRSTSSSSTTKGLLDQPWIHYKNTQKLDIHQSNLKRSIDIYDVSDDTFTFSSKGARPMQSFLGLLLRLHYCNSSPSAIATPFLQDSVTSCVYCVLISVPKKQSQ